MERKAFMMFAAFALFAIGSAEASEVYSVDDLVARIESTFAVAEGEAAAAGMSRKADAVGALPDLGVGYEIMDPDESEMATHKVSVQQELPLWGKRGLKRRAAAAEAKASAFMIAEAKLEIRFSLLKSLSEYHYALKIRRIRESELDALRKFVATTKVKYATGAAALSAVTQAEIERAETESMIVAMDAMAELARNEAFDMVDADSAASVIGPFIPVARTAPARLEAEALYAKALAHVPSLALAANDIELAEREKQLAGRELFPDLMLEFSYSYQSAAEKPGSLSAGFVLNLPVFSAKGKTAEIAMAAKRGEERVAALAGAKDGLYRRIRGLLAREADYRRRIALYASDILPLRAADLENRLAAYAVDKAEFEMVLESIRMRYDAEIALLELNRDYATTLLELEYLTGEKLVVFEDGRTE